MEKTGWRTRWRNGPHCGWSITMNDKEGSGLRGPGLDFGWRRPESTLLIIINQWIAFAWSQSARAGFRPVGHSGVRIFTASCSPGPMICTKQRPHFSELSMSLVIETATSNTHSQHKSLLRPSTLPFAFRFEGKVSSCQIRLFPIGPFWLGSAMALDGSGSHACPNSQSPGGRRVVN